VTADIVSLDRERRKREARAGNLPDPIIAKWRCRTSGCITLVGVTQTALDAFTMFNAELKRRREKPMTEFEVMYCERCAAERGNHGP
jgi:hypothetical protein